MEVMLVIAEVALAMKSAGDISIGLGEGIEVI